MADFKAIQQLDLNLLKVFESLYREQNMTRTAEALHITPSAVSHAIKRLRECLQDPLFERSKNSMLPTPACQRMAPLIIDNLSRLRQILQQWGEFDPQTSKQHFRIGLHDALEFSLLPRLAKTLAQSAPNVTFSSIKVERNQLVRELAAGHIDLAIDVAMPIKQPVHHQMLVDDHFCVLMRNGHPLVGQLTRERYLKSQHLVVSNRPSGPSMEDIQLQEQGYSRHIGIRCQNYFAAREIVKDSDVLLTLPQSLASQLTEDVLTIQPVPIHFVPMTTHLYWHANTQEDGALSWLRNLVIDRFAEGKMLS